MVGFELLDAVHYYIDVLPNNVHICMDIESWTNLPIMTTCLPDDSLCSMLKCQSNESYRCRLCACGIVEYLKTCMNEWDVSQELDMKSCLILLRCDISLVCLLCGKDILCFDHKCPQNIMVNNLCQTYIYITWVLLNISSV